MLFLNIYLKLSNPHEFAPQTVHLHPYYNRSGLLRRSLKIVIPQLMEFGNKVELLVSDNYSTDDTRSVVEELSQKYPINYIINDKNYGANQNILLFIQSRANGEFCWILGDDDIVRENGIKIIMDILYRNEDIDFFFVNRISERRNEERFGGRTETLSLLWHG